MTVADIFIGGLATEHTAKADELAALLTAAPEQQLPVDQLLAGVVIDPAARRVHVVSRDSSYSASIPIEDFRRGGVLTREAGGYRLRVMEGTTLCWNVKDVAELRFTATKEPDSVPERPTH